jgi:hypothetical protein
LRLLVARGNPLKCKACQLGKQEPRCFCDSLLKSEYWNIYFSQGRGEEV